MFSEVRRSRVGRVTLLVCPTLPIHLLWLFFSLPCRNMMHSGFGKLWQILWLFCLVNQPPFRDVPVAVASSWTDLFSKCWIVLGIRNVWNARIVALIWSTNVSSEVVAPIAKRISSGKDPILARGICIAELQINTNACELFPLKEIWYQMCLLRSRNSSVASCATGTTTRLPFGMLPVSSLWPPTRYWGRVLSHGGQKTCL